MKLIKHNTIQDWKIASKTKSIKAKPLVCLMADKSVLSKFLVDTLEGKEPLGEGSIICLGEAGDIWQQHPSKLLKKYTVVGFDDAGWMLCDPKPDNEVECVEIGFGIQDTKDGADIWITDKEQFFIIAQWGEERQLLDEIIQIQKCDIGDYICRDINDKSDVWIVKRKFFENTYNIIN